MTAITLPLFPLGTVLFPGGRLPLHVFELRYRRLVQDLIRQADEAPEFGVVAIRTGREVGAHGVQNLYQVGCTAELVGVVPHADGRFDIMTRGVRRFAIRRVHPPVADRTDQADVEFLPESPSPDDAALVASTSRLFHRYRRVMLQAQGRRSDSPFTLPDEPVDCSYLIAEVMALELADRQRLLEAPSVGDRLNLAAEFLRREIALIGQLSSRAGEELSRGTYSPN
ncbi:MAG TPA: LON peptidase substrate-binding domain-containing protein [Nakamurella sp.]